MRTIGRCLLFLFIQQDTDLTDLREKMLDADPEFAMFLRDIEALQKILEARSTIVLSADTMRFKLLKEMPDLTPKK